MPITTTECLSVKTGSCRIFSRIKKTGTGGLGGMTDGNPSLDGTTQVMFQDGKEISSFNQIYGAGAGGGGGALSVDENGSIAIGNGGDGSSGLVFIQW